MASKPIPQLVPPSQPSDDSNVEFGDMKVKIPLPRWAKTVITLLSVIASASTALGPIAIGIHKHHDEQRETIRQQQEKDHRAKDVQIEAVANVGNAQMAEYIKHSGQAPDRVAPIPTKEGTGKVLVAYYDNDGCLLVKRSTPDGKHDSGFWIRKITTDEIGPPPGPTGEVQQVGESGSLSAPSSEATDGKPVLIAALWPDQLRLPALSTAQSVQGTLRPVQACSGHCTQPHPGQPSIQNGQTNGCWVQVVRTWADGCSQYQWYDTCHSVWDPKIYWTCCKD